MVTLPRVIISIGVLTLIMAVLGFHILYILIEQGTWVGFTSATDHLTFFMRFVYFPIIMPVAASVIGIATLAVRKWTWKANLVLQLTFIGLTMGSLVIRIILDPLTSEFVLIDRQLAPVIGFVILYLLLRTKTRAYFQTIPRLT